MIPPSKHDPFRPPDWRWERARWLMQEGKYARRSEDDEYVLQVVEFLKARKRATTERAEVRLENKFPGIYNAHKVRNHPNHNVRYGMEARLLTTEPLSRIADRACTSEEVAFWFEKIFYNVMDYLHAEDYIANVAIGGSLHLGLADRDYDVLWKLFGYIGGATILDSLIGVRPNGSAAAFYDDNIKHMMKQKGAFSAHTLPVAFNQPIILETYSSLKALEQSDDGGDINAQMVEHIRSAMSFAGAAFRVTAPPPTEGGSLSYYDDQATELRAHEIIAVAAGHETEEMRSLVKFEFPEKPDEKTHQQGS